MTTVTIPRELAQSLLVLMTRDATEENVPAGQWLTFANALDKAMHAPRTHEDAPGATRDAGLPPGLTLSPALTPGRFCRFCKEVPVLDAGLCASCTDDLLRDASELEQSKHECPRCHDA